MHRHYFSHLALATLCIACDGALATRPSKQYCAPHVSLIRRIVDSLIGQQFCAEFNGVPPSTITATETLSGPGVKTTTGRGTVVETEIKTVVVIGTTRIEIVTETVNPVLTTVWKMVKLMTITITSKPTQAALHPRSANINSPAIPAFLSGIDASSISSACNCIVGFPTSVVETVTTTPLETLTIARTTSITTTLTTTLPTTLTSALTSRKTTTTTAKSKPGTGGTIIFSTVFSTTTVVVTA